MELFGGMSDAVKFILVFVLILAILIPLLWRRFSVGPLSPTAPRNRQPRLAVIDTTQVDVRRRLVLIKRDNVEHLLMIGGPTDIVVEANISRTGTVAREPRPIPDVRPDAARPAAAAEAPDWSLPLEPMGRPMRTVDLDAALSEPPARTAREAMVDSMRAVRSGAAARRNPAAEFDTPLAPDEIDAPALTPAPSMEINHRPAPLPEQRRAPPLPEPQRPQPAPEPASSDAPEPKRAATTPAPPRPVPPLQPAAPPTPGAGAPPPPPQRPVQPAAANGSAAPPTPRPVQSAPAAAAPAAPQPRQTQSDENSLAEMAQRLEAALRRPTKPAEVPPARPQGRKPVNPDAAGAKPAAKPADPPVPDLKVVPAKTRIDPAMESLEDEMAKMLGRSPGKS